MLEAKGRHAEVIDLRTLRPLDTNTVVQSVKKTNRAIVIDEAWKTGAFGAEIVSIIQDEAFNYLDGPVARVAGIDVPSPYSQILESAVIPTAERVLAEIELKFGI